MIIKKIILHPFAGIREREITFTDGLNVIVGKNEAGKSTIVRAILLALFIPTIPLKDKTKKEIENFLPIGGGDTINITMEFEIDEKKYVLTKSWGGTSVSKLIKPDSSVTTNPVTVQKELENLIRLNRATWENVLFAKQNTLSATIETIKKEKEKDIINSFSGILRGAVQLQGGISVEVLKQLLKNKCDDYYNNWNDILALPLNGTGIDIPHKNKVGYILKKYYEKETSRRNLKLSLDYDAKLDALAKKIEAIQLKLRTLQGFVETNKQLVDDVRKHSELTSLLNTIKLKTEKMQKDLAHFPILEANTKNYAQKLLELDEELKKINDELKIADKKASIQSKKEKFENASKILAQIKEQLLKTENLIKVDPTDLNEAKANIKILNDTQIKLAAQQLSLSIIAKKLVNAKLTRGIENEESLEIKPNEKFESNVSGRFILETDNFILNASSGNEDVQVLIEKINTANDKLNTIFKKYDVEKTSDLEALLEKEKQAKSDLQVLNKSLESVLGKDKIEDLSKEIKEVDQLAASRDVQFLRNEISIKDKLYAETKTKNESDAKALSELLNLYTSYKKLDDDLLDERVKQREIENKIKELKPLPENIASAEGFIKEFELKRDELDKVKIEFHGLSTERTELLANEPEKSSDELKAEIAVYENDFEKLKREGKAYSLILEKLDAILEVGNDAVFKPYYQKTQEYFEKLTISKYKELIMDTIVPSEISNGTLKFTTDLLSQGTNDSLALALRLSMSGYYLKDQNGFIAMDDPLTDMDPERQKAAASLIREFANDKQVLVFTCQPAHGSLLSNNCINI